MICLAVTYIIQPGHEAEALDLFHKMTEHTHKEPGNVLYIVHRSPNDPRRFFLYEQYKDQDALEAHRSADYFTQFITNGLWKITESRIAETYEPI
ncbi:MAG TPA: putative quinol monooxygenase [Ktedonobacteraceae bacterium]|nr:putative quinol monooxygenase [Ktedonobacteraceae bacterium]